MIDQEKVKEKINLLIDDLEKSIEKRHKTNAGYFTEELMIIRLKEILKEFE